MKGVITLGNLFRCNNVFSEGGIGNKKIWVVREGAYVPNDYINEIRFNEQPNGVGNWNGEQYGTGVNGIPQVVLTSERTDDTTDILGAMYFYQTGNSKSLLNGIPKPENATKLYIKGHCSKSANDVEISSLQRIAYGTGRYNDDGYVTYNPNNFEWEYDLTNYSVIWCMFGIGAYRESTSQFTVTFTIDEMYIE